MVKNLEENQVNGQGSFQRYLYWIELTTMLRLNLSILARRAVVARPAVAPRMAGWMRSYANASGLSKSEVESRIINVFRAFDKIEDPSKITSNAKFSTDLGLDSLDTVEVIVAVEEEFGIEIPEYEDLLSWQPRIIANF
jgi:NADH dehydrogenase (ubiquinone) 1 alpha/beta subcomplex 1